MDVNLIFRWNGHLIAIPAMETFGGQLQGIGIHNESPFMRLWEKGKSHIFLGIRPSNPIGITTLFGHARENRRAIRPN